MQQVCFAYLRLQGALELEDGVGGFGEFVGVFGLGVLLVGLGAAREGSIVEAGGYVDEGVAEVGGVDEVAVEHGVVADTLDR